MVSKDNWHLCLPALWAAPKRVVTIDADSWNLKLYLTVQIALTPSEVSL